MSDGVARPRPQYGEYATAEEQRARIRQPDATWAIETGQAPAQVASVEPVAPGAPASPASSAPRRGNVADRIVTIVLLALGLVHVAIYSVTLFFFDRVIVFMLEYYGFDPARLTDTTDLRLAGMFAGIAMIALWLLAAGSSWWLLRRGRVAFWIPIVGALIAMMVVGLFLDPVLSGEPVIQEMLESALSLSSPPG